MRDITKQILDVINLFFEINNKFPSAILIGGFQCDALGEIPGMKISGENENVVTFLGIEVRKKSAEWDYIWVE